MHHPDICIAGAGIIGLSLALELHHRGARVTILDRDAALTHASIAAAGMLAAHDPENPSPLKPLSELSVSLYPKFLSTIESLSGLAVPFQTSKTLQSHSSYPDSSDATLVPTLTPGNHRFAFLEEHSIDPRQLAAALLAAVRNTPIQLLEQTPLLHFTETSHCIRIETSYGTLETKRLVITSGAWSPAPVLPRKGQMLTVALPPTLSLREVIRTPEIYIVPRTQGPRTGHALIGATVEDAGFDTTTHPADLARLRALAAELLPALADETHCPIVDQWAGLRPATPDALPILGQPSPSSNLVFATGHYRNGILLAPATALVLAQLLSGENPSINLAPFSPDRFPTTGHIAQ
ncbi:NAD(P)/FAD-dependent oxidoreductase [Granulicella arctica]|uniref:Glycine oxidase n=1 Tax=Granulicella arctica TaxID=940613 RepID=A0A7Y9PK80_9BACT|nr:FAD-dependent oxidoreductase [Granulicella arctica]NYF81270.1 glycine oxidase [Granulicella arctica]